MKVGFIGLGNMGFAMAHNLLAGGFECRVYNRTPSRSQVLGEQGAIVCPSVTQLTRESEVAEALSDAWGSSRILLRNLPLIQERRFGPSQAPLRHLSKDLGFVADEASRLDLDLPLTERIQEMIERFIGPDKGDWDISSIFQLYSK